MATENGRNPANLMFALVADAQILARAGNEADPPQARGDLRRLTSVTYPG